MRVRLDGVVKRFKTMAALAGVSLVIEDGEFFTLLGPSGCGKTTTLRIIAGFYDSDEGTVYFDDVPQNGVPPAQRGIGIVFQNYALWPHMTVEGNIAYGLRLQHVPAAEIKQRIGDVLEQVGLTGLERRTPGQLSGGQQQRVAVARALVLNPRVLLLDEPLSNLDAKVRARLRSEIRRLQQDLRITTIYVTHDQEEAMVLSDRIAVMNAGMVLQIGTPVELYEHPDSLFVADFIGTSNLLPGEAVEIRGDIVAVRTSAGIVHGAAVGSVAPRMPVVVAVRPENVRLADGTAAETVLPGTVALTQYLGSLIRYEVEMAGGIVMRVDVGDPHRHTRLLPGHPIEVAFNSRSTQVFPREA
jgi:iron(III) transport system ATP-binding protein